MVFIRDAFVLKANSCLFNHFVDVSKLHSGKIINPSCNVAFERCIDVLAELIEKYAGKFAMDDIDYDYCVYIGNTPVTIVYSYEKIGNRFKDYYRQCYHNQDSGMKSEKSMCPKAS